MEIIIKQNILLKALTVVSKVAVGGRASLPVLNNILIQADKAGVSLSATNLDIAAIDFLPIKPKKEGKITVPARLLTDFIGNLPRNEEIKIEAKGTKVIVSSGKYQSVINGADAEDFPSLPSVDEKEAVKFIVGVDEFKNSLWKSRKW